MRDKVVSESYCVSICWTAVKYEKMSMRTADYVVCVLIVYIYTEVFRLLACGAALVAAPGCAAARRLSSLRCDTGPDTQAEAQ